MLSTERTTPRAAADPGDVMVTLIVHAFLCYLDFCYTFYLFVIYKSVAYYDIQNTIQKDIDDGETKGEIMLKCVLNSLQFAHCSSFDW